MLGREGWEIHMGRDGVSVTLAVGSAPWQKTLAASLLQAGMLRRVVGSGPNLEILEPNASGSLEVIQRFPINRAANRVLWGTWKRMPRRWRPPMPVMATVLLQERLCLRWIPPCDVFHGWMGQSLGSLTVAKRQGASTLIENAGRHPGDFHRAPDEECDRFNIKRSERSPLLPAALIRRMEREYEICDRIVVPSTVALASFTKFGHAAKTVVAFPGVDEQFFAPHSQPVRQSTFRVCFTGRVELVKGAGYLLQAWKRLALPNAELVLAGEVHPEMKSLLHAYADSSVRTTGFLPAKELLQHYRESDLFVFPSVNEGLAQVLLEAMASGLPVVASDLSGAGDCVTEGVEGFITPVRDVDRLVEAILWCYQHREETRAMGRAARARIERQFTLSHYNQQMIALYRSVAGNAA
jgi:glycosyltransferase involved in cell wall biosynthesis